MSRVRTLLENNEVRELLSENSIILENANRDFNGWYDTMLNFVVENIEEFLDETLEETYKNVYTFSTFATAQYLSEISHTYGREIEHVELIKEAQRHEFI